MPDTTKSLLEECYEQVYDVSQDPNNTAFAQTLGGVIAAGATVVAASPLLVAELAPPVAIATAASAAMGIHSAYNYGAEYGGPIIEPVIVPLEATAVFAGCAAQEGAVIVKDQLVAAQEGFIAAKDELVNDIVNIFSEPSSSAPPAQEPLSTPINDGFLVMDSQPASVFDSSSITTSEEPGPAPSYGLGAD